MVGSRCSLLGLLLVLAGSASTDAADQPNIVLIVADDLGYGELGCFGGKEIPTPNLNRLASDGIRFPQGYVTAPNCSPSRAGMLTGRIQTRFGYEFNPIGAKNDQPGVGLPLDQPTMAKVLHDAGYTTGLIGKWHLGGSAEFHPLRRGFDEFYGFLHEGHFYVPPPWRGVRTMLRRRVLPGGGQGRWLSDRLIYSTHMRHDEPPYDANNPILRGGQPVEEPRHLTEAISHEAVDFITRHRDKPFFLMLAYNAVHSPLQASDDHFERFAHIEDVHRRIFAAMLAQLDQGVGEVLDTLKNNQIDDSTLVVFLSDNGGPTRELTSRNEPLRGEKSDMYEGGLRVPFMIRWPARLRSGRSFDAPMSSLDLLPTFCAVAGIKPPNDLDGVDLLPWLSAVEPVLSVPHKSLYWRQGNKAALRAGDWKVVRPSGGPRAQAADRWELYRISEDISESHDLAATFPEKLNELREEWERWDEQMVNAK